MQIIGIFLILFIIGILCISLKYTSWERVKIDHKPIQIGMDLVIFLLWSLFWWAVLESSCAFSVREMLLLSKHGIAVIVLNIVTVAIIPVFLWAVTRRIWIAGFVGSSLWTLFALVNYFTLMYHGTPLSVNDIGNATTAVNILNTYELNMDFGVLKIFMAYGCCLFLCMVTRVYHRRKSGFGVYGLLAICIGIIFFGYYGEEPTKPKHAITWNWKPAYESYGVPACVYESFVQYLTSSPAILPDGYSIDAIETPTEVAIEETPQEYPDVILILNETFYDLNQITDTQANADVFENIHKAENISKGYAIIPGYGGGTNASEYELLTSNSVYLLPGITPFVNLNLNGRQSVVSHLNSLGYHTIGSHSEQPENYNRSTGYPAIGFDEIHFQDDFQDNEYIYSRWYKTDTSVYRNMTRWHEAAYDQEGPVFSYLLTIQNHGDWNFNTDEQNTVKAATDYGENDHSVDEYLTCIQRSDQAWQELIEYYSQSDRKVIICMMGDHSPIFGNDVFDPNVATEENELAMRRVPLVMWDNFSEDTVDLGTMSINYVVPTLLERAGIPLTPYYEYMLELKKDVPVLTSYGTYITADGTRHAYEEDTKFKESIQKYFYLEYHNLMEKIENIKYEWFYLIP